jgi:hypothetical protein
MDKKDRELLEIIKDLKPHKNTIEKVLDQRISELEWNSFRYFKGEEWTHHGKKQHNKVIETKKIRNLISHLLYEEEK